MELNEMVCKAYVMNARNRRHQCELWDEMLIAMPIGVAMTATEVAEKASENRPSWWPYSYYQASHALNAMKKVGIIERRVVDIEPYEIEVEVYPHWSNSQQCFVEGGKKKITIDKKTVFIRMV